MSGDAPRAYYNGRINAKWPLDRSGPLIALLFGGTGFSPVLLLWAGRCSGGLQNRSRLGILPPVPRTPKRRPSFLHGHTIPLSPLFRWRPCFLIGARLL